VLKLAEAAMDAEAVWPCVEPALRRALAQLVKMREKEGKFLADDLVRRLDLLAQVWNRFGRWCRTP